MLFHGLLKVPAEGCRKWKAASFDLPPYSLPVYMLTRLLSATLTTSSKLSQNVNKNGVEWNFSGCTISLLSYNRGRKDNKSFVTWRWWIWTYTLHTRRISRSLWSICRQLSQNFAVGLRKMAKMNKNVLRGFSYALWPTYETDGSSLGRV